MASNIDLFFNTSRNKRTFPEVLAEIQEYLASKYSTLITDNPEEQHRKVGLNTINAETILREE